MLGLLQRGYLIGLPTSRPMPSIGAHCHELRINDESRTWRVIYRINTDAIVILEVFDKKTQATPKRVINACKARMKAYDDLMRS